ncbi:hypothetical protein ABGB14_46930 [Nonomuraea sp. B10E15]|uniref:hypothetical protein n=1 Tax=Nonomuraea sp. B10E15 TaxID=3153560 RepID=UPI00325F8293
MEPSSFVWETYNPTGGTLRISYTSCCGAFELASEGGHFFVLRSTGDGGYEETGRGLHRQAMDLYITLAERHRDEHLRRGERPEPDTFLQDEGQRG